MIEYKFDVDTSRVHYIAETLDINARSQKSSQVGNGMLIWVLLSQRRQNQW